MVGMEYRPPTFQRQKPPPMQQKNRRPLSDTAKQFLLTLIATTISIILTFGTSAWLDHRKQESAKHEMVMMILYDIANTIDEMTRADSLLRAGFEKELQVLSHPEILQQNPFIFTTYIPMLNYTETVEQIFSSNIETINTIGNVVFAEEVSEIYALRRRYKENICQNFADAFEENGGFSEYGQAKGLSYETYIYMSGLNLASMKERLARCMQLMEVSPDELTNYRSKRQELYHAGTSDSVSNALYDELNANVGRIHEALNTTQKEEP